ncbi:outer arm dynein light chain 1 [Dendrothele bispora CBS 962.96]|uniref:Outer arm dynein light chain 1 n=1 Tax=Dendrothele bispora (strain CBS 962.96) TaxID=1314807 RepID=A0A4S8M779_DENBC|nr:outer arm dynein light chain 1 [Dendrothele bispora CBS 962.96]
MSRLPPPSTRDRSRSPMKPSPSPSPSKSRMGTTTPVRATTPVRTRTKSSTGPRKPVEKEEPPPTPTMSIKEQIALKRAEAKKAMTARSGGGDGGGLNDMSSLEDAIPGTPPPPPEEDILGRWSVRETIERARSSGSLNLSSRSLECLPPELYEIHLGITPDALKLVPNPTPLPPSEPSVAQKRGKRDNPAWFEAQDLQTLKAPNNEILEIQHEISLFGSLKVIDLHKNKLTSLPRTFGDLASLTSLDLSNNALTSIPTNIFTFPDLTHLNLSHNQLTSLPFNEPFASGRKFEASGGNFFAPTVNRTTSPLPRLANFDASYNKISADAIDLVLPSF